MTPENPHREPTVDTRRTVVGSQIGPLQVDRISRTTLALFAGASGDHNEIHIDTDFAREAGFPDVFAHGMLSMAFLGRLLTDTYGIKAVRELSTRFVTITPVGASPTISGTVTDVVTGTNGERLAHLDLVATLEDGTVTLQGSAQVVLG